MADARAFAIRAHGDQRYGDLPYSVHLDDVAAIARRLGDRHFVDPGAFVRAAYLHDVLEDTDATIVVDETLPAGRWELRIVPR